MSDNVIKGDKLEKAVLAIENLILRHNPSGNPTEFKIENKHKRKINGALYEIDIYVELIQPKGYDSVFIFECKNWKKKIGRKELSDFIQKIKKFNATRGFFIANNFTRDAEAMARSEDKLELVTAIHDYSPLTELLQLEDIRARKVHRFIFLEPGDRHDQKDIPEVNDNRVIFGGETIDIQDFMQQTALATITHEMGKVDKLNPGINKFSIHKVIPLKRDLQLQGRSIDRVCIKMDFTIKAYTPKLKHTINVGSRGSYSKIEAKLEPGEEYMEIEITAI